ncbi:MAG: hypothetical protein GY859_31415 [Desulfobacterales bacterium]|nr:hypothetical protein [Desulfobacterales bacterium]
MGYALTENWSYAEPRSAAGAAALLVGERPPTFQPDVGASGYCGHEVMDARGPAPDSEAADADLSLISMIFGGLGFFAWSGAEHVSCRIRISAHANCRWFQRKLPSGSVGCGDVGEGLWGERWVWGCHRHGRNSGCG